MIPKRSDKSGPAGEKARRRPHSIRFLDPEWERIEAFADARGLTAPEFVRFAALVALRDGSDPVARLAPLIERTFRGTFLLASRMRAEMLAAGDKEELDAMIATARKFQDELLDSASE